MAVITQSVSIPVWLLILMIAVMLPSLFRLFKLFYLFKRGEIVREENSDMVVWKVKSRQRSVSSTKKATDLAEAKQREQKSELVQVLKILLKEGDRGVRMQSVADQMGAKISRAQTAMKNLVEKKMVEEVIGVSGTKYYLTQLGKDYCRRKAG